MKITTIDYILVAVGILTLPFFIGLVILGVVMWRIGSSIQKDSIETSDTQPSQNVDASKEKVPIETTPKYIEDEMEDFAPIFLDKRYKLKQYSEDTLEDGK